MNVELYHVSEAKTDEEILSCFSIFQLLRPHLEKEGFVEAVRGQQKEGYRLIFIADNGGIKSAAGYRVMHYLAWGRVLYIDDMITLPEARGIGFGTHLLKWLKKEAVRQNCDGVHLDTGILREEAHRLYLNMGLKIDGLHFSMQL